MPRQPIIHTVPQPLEPLNIEEVRFWLDIMQEHALFIKMGLPCDRTDLINEAQNFIREFDTLGNRAERLQNEKKFKELVSDAYDVVCEFHRFKRHLLRLKLTCKLAGSIFPIQYDHLAREAEYVMRLFDKMRTGRPGLKAAAKTQETSFWVRIMGEHAALMSHLIDPSERSLVATARDFSEDFDALLLQSNDFASMLSHNENDVPSFRRFLQDVHTSTRQLRDFKRAVQEMIAQCKLVGLIPEMLADHVRREAEHFLMILAMMEKGIITCVTATEPECEVVEAIEDMEEEFCPGPAIECGETVEDCEDQDEEACYEEEDCEEPQANFNIYKSPAVNMDDIEDIEGIEDDIDDDCNSPEPPKTAPAKQKPPKYKWGGKWPRPLGK
ncbi:hypothetical protein SDC9_04109 [bioreactor metagenome]|uniref:DUF2935 domain-containing protein n=1 Tax=bioreactor metagenome TaxID=1076179 RepID=A0A644SVC4_9ZZZZ